ncbi:uncharacterized protein FOMMEDRAFT_151090 [Fomitiporia mediterranea MF3/22]|uniref:uncharacterized protein n=1 Tax=Fomitiporia mediterranea (strain MF3/22) TaxID=694068 RepID=UPI00044088B8|nr:uncharacterized protein FOMMEDRAFT_151090 [Fomitiporia mediterranea MF3/22]EJD08319.1 hypothetical protein FOMMEDRAFT_151090 [Fomitiporia mediterranea MF3/22]
MRRKGAGIHVRQNPGLPSPEPTPSEGTPTTIGTLEDSSAPAPIEQKKTGPLEQMLKFVGQDVDVDEERVGWIVVGVGVGAEVALLSIRVTGHDFCDSARSSRQTTTSNVHRTLRASLALTVGNIVATVAAELANLDMDRDEETYANVVPIGIDSNEENPVDKVRCLNISDTILTERPGCEDHH